MDLRRRTDTRPGAPPPSPSSSREARRPARPDRPRPELPPRSSLPARPAKPPRQGLGERHSEQVGMGAAASAVAAAPRQRRAFSTFGGPVDSAGDPGEARALTELWDVDAGLARALTHGFHSYAGRMHPSIARGAIGRYSRPGDLVVDPFCGSGTVLVESFGLGRASLGVDASPLGVAIAQVRTDTLGAAGRAQLVAEATRIAEESGENARKRRPPEVPAWGKREFERFFPHVAFELFGLRALIMGTPKDTGVGRALRLCLSSILVKVMRAGPEAPRDGADKRIGRGIPSRLLVDRATELARGLAALEKRAPTGTAVPLVRLGDARELAAEPGSARLVLSSPPYAGTYDYVAQHDVRFAWLELPRRKFESTQLGARNPATMGFGAEPVAWREAQARWVSEIARVLAPGGRALLVVGDGIVGDAAEYAPSALAAVAEPVGLAPIARASQARHLMDRRLRALFGDEPRCEHLLLFEKE